MPNEALKKFAEELKAARESQDITLQQIANRTKIDLKFLQAIEECKFDVLPELYMRAFIKEYAQTVELDPDETIEKFDSCLHGKPEEKQTPETKNETEDKQVVFESTAEEKKEIKSVEETKPEKINRNVILLGIAAVVIIVLVYFLFIDNSSKEIISQNNYSDPVTENMPAFELDSVKTPPVEKAIQDDSLHLSINTLKRVWVKVVTDKSITKFEGMVNGGRNLLYNASEEFRVVVGNAGSVEMSLDGKPINNIGNPGEVRNIIINPDTVIAYTLLIPSKNENKPQQKN